LLTNELAFVDAVFRIRRRFACHGFQSTTVEAMQPHEIDTKSYNLRNNILGPTPRPVVNWEFYAGVGARRPTSPTLRNFFCSCGGILENFSKKVKGQEMPRFRIVPNGRTRSAVLTRTPDENYCPRFKKLKNFCTRHFPLEILSPSEICSAYNKIQSGHMARVCVAKETKNAPVNLHPRLKHSTTCNISRYVI